MPALEDIVRFISRKHEWVVLTFAVMAVKFIDPCHGQAGYTAHTTSLELYSRTYWMKNLTLSYKVVEGPPAS